MVNSSTKALKERGGSTLKPTKKYIAANLKDEAEKVGTFIKKYLQSSVAFGVVVQTKGEGASGSSFK